MQYEELYQKHIDEGIPVELAHELTLTRGLFAATDIIEIAHQRKMPILEVAEMYFGIGGFLDLSWIRTQVIVHPAENQWESLSREALRDDLDWQQRQLTDGLIHINGKYNTLQDRIEAWAQINWVLIERWNSIIIDLKASVALNYIMFFVATRELSDLTQTTCETA